ncbi:MAG: Dabb family protein [bacterium]
MNKKWIFGLISVSVVCALIGMGIAGAYETKTSGSQSKETCPMGMAGCQKAVRHVVAFKFKDSASAEAIQEVNDAFANLKNEIPFILSYEAGTNVSPEKLDKGFTHCYILTFKNQEDRDAYLPHPAHKAFGQRLHPILEDVFVIDFEASACCGGGACGSGSATKCDSCPKSAK